MFNDDFLKKLDEIVFAARLEEALKEGAKVKSLRQQQPDFYRPNTEPLPIYCLIGLDTRSQKRKPVTNILTVW